MIHFKNTLPAWSLLVAGLTVTALFTWHHTAPGGPIAWQSALVGLAASLLVFALHLVTLRQNERTARRADALTADASLSKEALKASELRWKFALEGSNLGVWDWSVAHGTVYYNLLWKTMLGHTEEEIGSGFEEWRDRLHPEDSAAAQAYVTAYLAGQLPAYASEHRLRCKDGSYKWILARGMIVERTASGEPARVIGTHEDITLRRQLEASWLQSRTELQAAQRIAQVGNWQLDLTSGHVVWSDQLYLMLGLDPADEPPNYNTHAQLFTADSWARLSAAVEATQQTGIPYELELEMIRADGQLGWMLARGEAIRGGTAEVSALRGVAVDITARKSAQLQSQHVSKLYAAQSACNAAILHCPTRSELFEQICQVVVDFGGMTLAWIGAADAETGHIAPIHAYGACQDYLDGLEISIHDIPLGRGPTGTAMRENRPVWFDDFQSEPRMAPWLDRGRKFGWRASAALPLRCGGVPVAVLTFYSPVVRLFDDEVRHLLGEMAEQISHALDKLESDAAARASRTVLEASEQRFRSVVEQAIAGAFIVQRGKLIYVNPRFAEILGYRDPAELEGQDPLPLIAPGDRDRAQFQMAELLEQRSSRFSLSFTAMRCDGTTTEVTVNGSLATYQHSPAFIGLLQDVSDKQVAQDHIRRYTQKLERTFMQTVALATTLSEMRDPYTAGHERRVSDIAVAIAAEMGLTGSQLEGIKVGGYLHDVGKTAIPAEILSKPGRLSALEFELIKSHAQAGHEVLKDVEFPWPVAQIALQHHERMDGSGYPLGLVGEAILLEARIIAVADVVEAMGSHRPYRAALGVERALAEVERGSGTVYDAEAVAACTRLFRDRGYSLPM